MNAVLNIPGEIAITFWFFFYVIFLSLVKVIKGIVSFRVSDDAYEICAKLDACVLDLFSRKKL